ncbi:hypothetical protein [Nocardia australiensis]|uniref:hypothetical protein n=1 Tax=Nocardia australiensis TaxID=2887191 RepID=UPI001D147131|nr:hypothetical protein [Nocardia australiensis]
MTPEPRRPQCPWAHTVMQVHIDCALCVCPVKQQAKLRLIEAKRLVPDSNRP